MHIHDLAPETIERIKNSRWDRIIEKHEGPETWAWKLKDYAPDHMIFQMAPNFDPIASRPEFMPVGSHWVLFIIDYDADENR